MKGKQLNGGEIIGAAALDADGSNRVSGHKSVYVRMFRLPKMLAQIFQDMEDFHFTSAGDIRPCSAAALPLMKPRLGGGCLVLAQFALVGCCFSCVG